MICLALKNNSAQKLFFIFTTFFFAKDVCSQKIIEDKCLDFGYCIFDSVRKPDVLLIHSSYCPTQKDSFNLTCILDLYKRHEVAAHYIIDRDGKIYKLINTEQVAYHGGKGEMPDGNNQINARSVGVELINTKTSYYTQNQYFSLIDLWNEIKLAHQINIITGHADAAPQRKTDPWNFDWRYFKQLLKEDSAKVWRRTN